MEEIKHSNSNIKRKYVCKYDYEYSQTSICQFISGLGKYPEKYEIITVFRHENGKYEVFYKEYIE